MIVSVPVAMAVTVPMAVVTMTAMRPVRAGPRRAAPTPVRARAFGLRPGDHCRPFRAFGQKKSGAGAGRHAGILPLLVRPDE
ncbi:MAG TPA: hypothetical protein VKY73_20665 [Polyangiaceae bacterium]|nr:hypothetical protein [Polyangiaceae bacterium]